MERRYFAIELREEGDGAAPKLTGYAAVFDTPSQLLYGEFKERIVRGAFAASIAADDIRALWNHDTGLPLGRTKNNTLRLIEDSYGLRVEIEPPDTQAGRDALASVKRGDVDQMSFAFDMLDQTWDRDSDGVMLRTLTKVRLYDVSPVVFPAYPQTSISARGDQAAWGDIPAIPDRFRRGEDGADAEPARARLAMMSRELDLIEQL
jgi:hypothetical protein